MVAGWALSFYVADFADQSNDRKPQVAILDAHEILVEDENCLDHKAASLSSFMSIFSDCGDRSKKKSIGTLSTPAMANAAADMKVCGVRLPFVHWGHEYHVSSDGGREQISNLAAFLLQLNIGSVFASLDCRNYASNLEAYRAPTMPPPPSHTPKEPGLGAIVNHRPMKAFHSLNVPSKVKRAELTGYAADCYTARCDGFREERGILLASHKVKKVGSLTTSAGLVFTISISENEWLIFGQYLPRNLKTHCHSLKSLGNSPRAPALLSIMFRIVPQVGRFRRFGSFRPRRLRHAPRPTGSPGTARREAYPAFWLLIDPCSGRRRPHHFHAVVLPLRLSPLEIAIRIGP